MQHLTQICFLSKKLKEILLLLLEIQVKLLLCMSKMPVDNSKVDSHAELGIT